MFDKLNNEFRFQQQALKLMSHRQNILAANIANADTPSYLARDIDFNQQLKEILTKGDQANESLELTRSSSRHIAGMATLTPVHSLLYRIPDQPSADGNTVDMDRERVNFADNNVKYQSSLTILSSQIKNMLNVIS